ncbi:Intradiol ring-cleavage dioxygenase [Clohesyomyces aquaticus]|uniref:Intradiol ring-cleavage dioxygenase n=1 Tax=Clohesyomyces aquaticus TaxID=1231657 RepID=A0A1Y1Z396_9PLEO|nr:Intradiol ring-cleavage dioxygenase [Clohesyomyces aquaticus]
MRASAILKLALVALSTIGVLGHPYLSERELQEYKLNQARGIEALGNCLASPEMHEHQKRMIEERTAALQHIRKARGVEFTLESRDKLSWLKWLSSTHEKHGHSKDPQDLFNFKWNEAPKANTAGCVLTPQSIYGPFWKDSQPERQDLRAGEEGVYMRLAMQVIDVTTCMPMQGARVDAWHANAMGTYSGNATGFLRGFQWSSGHGTADFDTIFPGHYTDRATHVHVTVRPEGGKRYAHEGMIYFDEGVRGWIERNGAYKNNKQELKLNQDDDFAPMSASDRFDPLVQWQWVGRYISDGILAWIALGVNASDMGVPQPRKRTFDDHLDR